MARRVKRNYLHSKIDVLVDIENGKLTLEAYPMEGDYFNPAPHRAVALTTWERPTWETKPVRYTREALAVSPAPEGIPEAVWGGFLLEAFDNLKGYQKKR